MLLLAEILMLYGPPAAGVGNVSFHLPLASVVVVACLPQLALIVTLTLGLSVPQIGAAVCYCNTIPLLKKSGMRIRAAPDN